MTGRGAAATQEKWDAYYQCKGCQSKYVRENKKIGQKRQCSECRKLNAPYHEVSLIIFSL